MPAGTLARACAWPLRAPLLVTTQNSSDEIVKCLMAGSANIDATDRVSFSYYLIGRVLISIGKYSCTADIISVK